MTYSTPSRKVLLIGNYPPDGQRSMERFASLFYDGLVKKGWNVELQRPFVLLNHWTSKGAFFFKWLGYIDKFILFPIYLFFKSRYFDLVHICDHSNSPYLYVLDRYRCLVTCHDCLAIRAGRGEFKEIRIGLFGRVLQKWILSGLKKAIYVECDSESSKKDVLRLTQINEENVSVIFLGKQSTFQVQDEKESEVVVKKNLPDYVPCQRYILHVSNNNWYKNRRGLIRIYGKLCEQRNDAPILVMAGAPLTKDMLQDITRLGLGGKVVNMVGLNDYELCCFYNQAEFLVLPSFEEGFGWPIIEAFSCGCRVLTSRRSSMAELGGDAAFYADPYDEYLFVEKMNDALLEGVDLKKDRIQRGFKHLELFSNELMVEKYVATYQKILKNIPE